MSIINWKKSVGQERIKGVFSSALKNNSLGHAYLFCGDAGCGKFATAFDIAQTLLCTSEYNRPCGECISCKKIERYAHSDFHVIMPLSLEKQHKSSDGKLSEAGWQYLSNTVIDRIQNPYSLRRHSSIPVIPVEWVKEVNHAIMRGPLEGNRNIVIMDGVDLMAKESANAMLKTLEEPPEGALMLLCTNRIHAVLPTIISRCQILRFAWLTPESIKGELSKRYSVEINDPVLNNCVNTGSLGVAQQLFENPLGEITQDSSHFWQACIKQDWSNCVSMIDKLIALDDYGSYEKVFTEILQGIRISFFETLKHSENYIKGDTYPEFLIPGISTPAHIGELVELCECAIRNLKARANVALVFANFAISVMEIINGKKC